MRRPPLLSHLLFLTVTIPAIFVSVLASAAGAGLGPEGAPSPGRDELVFDANSRVFMPAVSSAGRKATPTPASSPTPTPTSSGSSGSSAVYTIFGNQAPTSFDLSDTSAVELGVKFRPTVNGYVLGVRFYKHSQSTGPHIGNLWTSGGTRLASATFTNETSSGWQQVYFPTPVPVTANATYVASVFMSQGRYAQHTNYFTTTVSSGPLQALADGVSGPNGVYVYSSTSAFPNNGYQASNYWVDVLFSLSSGSGSSPAPSVPTPTPTPAGNLISWPTPTPTPLPSSPSPTPTATPGSSSGGSGPNATTTGVLTLTATYRSISVYAGFSGDANANNSAVLEYRKVGQAGWVRGMDLTVDRRTQVYGANASYPNPFAFQWRGAVLLAEPNTDYEVRVTFADPDGVSGPNPLYGRIRTRNEDPPALGATYYVDGASGSDSNPGSLAAPFKTIAKALSLARAGDKVYVRAGTYPPFEIATSGAADNYLVISAYPGERPKVSAPQGAGVLISIKASYVRVSGFELSGGQWGVLVGGSAHDVIIENNLIYGQQAANQEGVPVQIGDTFSTQNPVANVTVRGNEIRADTLPEPETDLILVKAASGGHAIYRNRVVFYYPGGNVHGTDCIGGIPNFAPHGGYFKDTDVYENYCSGATDEGIEIDGGNANIRVWANTIVGANMGFSITPVYYGPVYVFRNVVYNLKDHWVGSCGLVKDGESGSGAVYFYHNTFYSVDGPACKGAVKGFVKYGGDEPQANVVIKNNIIWTWSRLYETGSKFADFNLNYVEPASGDKVAEYNGVNYWSWDAFRAGTGLERDGLWGTPVFVNPAGGDFRLAAGSPGIDRGQLIPGFNDQNSPWPFKGSAPDLGAFESG